MRVAHKLTQFVKDEKTHIRRFLLSFIWRWPLMLIVGGFITVVLQSIFPSEIVQLYSLSDFQDSAVRAHVLTKFWTVLFWAYLLSPIFMIAGLYLEWDKYKKDKPSGFVYGKFWNEGYRGYTTRKQELRQDKIMVGGHEVAAQVLGNDHRLFAGNFSEAHLNKHLKKYIGWWNKPIETTQGHEKWRILIRDGRELHIHLQRQATQPAHWIMTTEFYEWAGRNKPPQLAETHVTEFVCQG